MRFFYVDTNLHQTDKHKVILPKTWQIASKEDRLASARHDLIKAGYPEDARLLTISRLNGCWSTKVSSPERKALKEGRKKRDGSINTPAVARKRAHKEPKQGTFFFPLFRHSSLVIQLLPTILTPVNSQL